MCHVLKKFFTEATQWSTATQVSATISKRQRHAILGSVLGTDERKLTTIDRVRCEERGDKVFVAFHGWDEGKVVEVNAVLPMRSHVPSRGEKRFLPFIYSNNTEFLTSTHIHGYLIVTKSRFEQLDLFTGF